MTFRRSIFLVEEGEWRLDHFSAAPPQLTVVVYTINVDLMTVESAWNLCTQARTTTTNTNNNSFSTFVGEQQQVRCEL